MLGADEKVGQRFRAAYLVDPVDLFSPSAVEALERSGRRLGVTGGGVWGPLNPPLVNYAVSKGGGDGAAGKRMLSEVAPQRAKTCHDTSLYQLSN